MIRKKALVVCPGRGTYNKEELGYFSRHHDNNLDLLSAFDAKRTALGQETLSALDRAERYSIARHTSGDNASALIYACAISDFAAINREEYDIVAVTGNSMGWYIAPACVGTLDEMGGFVVINTMGTLMQKSLIGGQIIYPFVDENWVEIPGKRAALLAMTKEIPNLYISIHLGGMIVFAGGAEALDEAEGRLEPAMDRFPARLQNHAGFHSPLQTPISQKGLAALPASMFSSPDIPLIDGRGYIWYPEMIGISALHDYTLGHQVIKPYDFSRAITNWLREFAPDVLIVLGPGNTLGGAVAQCLIQNEWKRITDKNSFVSQQATDPFVLSMGLENQREMVTSHS